jgi:SNF2-related domain
MISTNNQLDARNTKVSSNHISKTQPVTYHPRHVYGRLDVCIYHGRGREENPEMLAKADIVFTTYHTIASSAEGLKAESPLFRVCWFRIVLDEGM